MNIREFSSRLVFACAMLLAASMAWTPQAIAGREDQAIIADTRKYLAANSYPPGMKLVVQKVDGDYARVAMTPNDPKFDGALILLKRDHGTWKKLSIGTYWNPADLDKMHIPKSLRP